MAQIASVADQPASCPSADGSTELHGYIVRGVIYAPQRRDVTRLLDGCLELDVAEIVGRIPAPSARAARHDARVAEHLARGANQAGALSTSDAEDET